jgi:hypothetical protein
MKTIDRESLNFSEKAREVFSYLSDEGFLEAQVMPTLVRYLKDGIEVDIFHGRQSYEIGAGVSADGERFSLSEIIRMSDQAFADQYRNYVATTPVGINEGLEELSLLLRRFGGAALQGDRDFFLLLKKQRKQWAEKYALEVLSKQLLPKANDAFRRGDYAAAADLYGRIRDCLSPAEIKKLALAEERRGF